MNWVERRGNRLRVDNLAVLRHAFTVVKQRHPSRIDAVAVLSDYFKLGLVSRVADWTYFSCHVDVEKGVYPICRQLEITPGCQLNFIVENAGLRVEVKHRIPPTKPEAGYGLLVCKQPGARHLADFEHLLGLAHVHVEEWWRVSQALNLQAEGLDFADASHLTA